MIRRSEYELVIIAHPQLGSDEEGLPALMTRVQGWIEGAGGELTYDDLWGRRRLAYPIRKQTEGSYMLLRAWLPHQAIVELERELALADDILRYLLVRAETPPPPKRTVPPKPAEATVPEPAEESESEPETEGAAAAEAEVDAETAAEGDAEVNDGDHDDDDVSVEGADEGEDEAEEE